jgi:A/G-specific adenine glycosylase
MKYKPLSVNYFARRVLQWYYRAKRDLPWRNERDAYTVWVAEIILQQTRVEQGLPYFNRFIETFPDVFSLAKASEQSVLKIWEGLGYYSRARNMHKCAQIIVNNNHGSFPKRFEDLLQLPGIGKYTAAAIASFAYHEAVPAIDANVIRVLTRIFRIHEDPHKPKTQKLLFEKSLKLISKDNPDHYNQAMMELGALICKPKKPSCARCPVMDCCEAYASGDQQKYPYKKARGKIRKRYFNYVILKSGDKTYFQLRNGDDIWKGLYEFFLIESKAPIDISDILHKVPIELLEEPRVLYESKEYKHQLSHQEIRARFIEISSPGIQTKQWLKPFLFKKKMVKDLPKSVLLNKYLEERPI